MKKYTRRRKTRRKRQKKRRTRRTITRNLAGVNTNTQSGKEMDLYLHRVSSMKSPHYGKNPEVKEDSERLKRKKKQREQLRKVQQKIKTMMVKKKK
jgi:hypothetical protein